MPPPDDASRKVCWNHPLHDYDPTSSSNTDNSSTLNPEQPSQSQQEQQRTPPRAERHSSHSPLREDDWHQYTLHNTPRTPSTPPTTSSPAKLPSNYTQGPQRYKSLTGLLLQSGASPTYGVEADDESYKHMSIVNDGSMFDLDDSGSGRRKNRGRC